MNDPKGSFFIEYHAHKTSEIYDVILSGMVAREQPLMVIITTAGFDLSCPCFKEYQYVSKIIDPNNSVENETYFVMICELDEDDDITDERVWRKANPIVATYEAGLTYLREELKAALDAPEKMRGFLTKNMNKWVDMKDEGYMNMQKWSESGEDFTMSDFEGMECIAGLDLSTKLDLTSIGFEFIKENNYYVFQHSFIPEETYDKKLRESKYPFHLWKEEGNLTVTPGAVIDYQYIYEYIKKLESTYYIKIKEICYDPYNASMFVQTMEQEGYTMVEIRQGPFTLNEPTKDFRDKVYEKRLKHNGDGLLTWAIGNAVTKQNAQEFIMLDKAKSNEKIDPIACLINAHTRSMILEPKQDIFIAL